MTLHKDMQLTAFWRHVEVFWAQQLDEQDRVVLVSDFVHLHSGFSTASETCEEEDGAGRNEHQAAYIALLYFLFPSDRNFVLESDQEGEKNWVGRYGGGGGGRRSEGS